MDFYNTTLYRVDGTELDDVIVNVVQDSHYTDVYGLGGNDQITNFAGNFFADGGEGNDYIANYGSNYVGLYGGDGDDYVVNFASNCPATVGLRGGYGNDTLVSGGFGMAELDAGEGNDFLVGGSAVDIFEISSTDSGVDVILNYDSLDIIHSYGSYSDFNLQVSGADVIIFNKWGGAVIIPGGALQQFNFFTYDDSQDSFDQLVAAYEEMLGVSYDTADDALGNANQYFGTKATDNIFVSKNDGNDFVFDTAANDTVHFYDAALSDIVSTSVTDTAIEIEFDTGDITRVVTSDDVSPTFKFTSGESYVYNRTSASWQAV